MLLKMFRVFDRPLGESAGWQAGYPLYGVDHSGGVLAGRGVPADDVFGIGSGYAGGQESVDVVINELLSSRTTLEALLCSRSSHWSAA